MQIIVSIDPPTSNDSNASVQWQKTVEKCELLAKQKGIAGNIKLGLGAWLLHSESGLPFLWIVFSQSEEGKYSYRLIVIEKCSSWSSGPVGFDSAKVFGSAGKGNPANTA